MAGFSLHAGVSARADQRQKLERLCRYISRPAVSEKRLSRTPNGNVRYELKTPYRAGTTQVIFEPEYFIARLAARVPTLRVKLTRLDARPPWRAPCGRTAWRVCAQQHIPRAGDAGNAGQGR